MTREIIDYINESACAECGGDCCGFLLAKDAKASSGVEVPTWHINFFAIKKRNNEALSAEQSLSNCSVIRDIFLYDAYRKTGYDWMYCAYRGPKGCVLPRENRPRECREYRCEYLKSQRIRHKRKASNPEKLLEANMWVFKKCCKNCVKKQECLEFLQRLNIDDGLLVMQEFVQSEASESIIVS